MRSHVPWKSISSLVFVTNKNVWISETWIWKFDSIIVDFWLPHRSLPALLC